MEYGHTGFCLVCRRAHEPDQWLMDCIAEGDATFSPDFLIALSTAARAIRRQDMVAGGVLVTVTPCNPLFLGVPRWSVVQWQVIVDSRMQYALPTILQCHFFITLRRAERSARRLGGRVERSPRETYSQ